MAKANITQDFCNGLLKRDRDGVKKYTDNKLSGFQLRIGPSNHIVFYACARLSGSKQRLDRKIGRLGKVTLAEARKTARNYLVMMENGQDPYEMRFKESRKKTVNIVAEEFLEKYASIKVKPRTAEEYRRHIDKEIVPRFGRVNIADIELKHLRKLHHDLLNHPVKANRVLATFSKFLNWAEEEEYRDVHSNPAKLVKKYKEEKRVRRLSREELVRINAALKEYKKYNPYYVAFVQLLLLTGARRDEIRTCKWDYINFDQKQIELPDSKTGKKVIPLSEAAIGILKSLTRQHGNDYVFCGFKVGRPIVNVRKPWVIITANASISDITLHDLRRTYASALLEHNVPLTVISNLLGHKSTKTTERYLGVNQSSMRIATDLASNLVS